MNLDLLEKWRLSLWKTTQRGGKWRSFDERIEMKRKREKKKGGVFEQRRGWFSYMVPFWSQSRGDFYRRGVRIIVGVWRYRNCLHGTAYRRSRDGDFCRQVLNSLLFVPLSSRDFTFVLGIFQYLWTLHCYISKFNIWEWICCVHRRTLWRSLQDFDYRDNVLSFNLQIKLNCTFTKKIFVHILILVWIL